MADFLEDGSVVPSHLSVEREGHYGDSWNNPVLRVGEVQEIIYPDDQRSISKRIIEYRVAVQHRDVVTNTGNRRDYLNCWLINPFGGLADKMHYTLRGDNSSNRTDKKTLIGLGSKVLILCINGDHRNAIIIGGVRDKIDTDDKNLGHHLHFVFNGVDAFVNKDGELTLTCKGASRLDGTETEDVDTKLIGTTVQLLKTGNFKVSTGDGKQTMLIDRKNQLTELRCTDSNSTQYIQIDFANGKIKTVADKEWNLQVSNGKAIIESGGVEVGDASDAWMLGTTYRRAESTMNQKLAIMLQSLQVLVQTVGTALTSAGGSMVVPIAGAVIAAPQVTASGVALMAASQLITQMKQAIDSFEQDADSYLSKKNKTD